MALNMLYGITAQLKISNENCIKKLGEIFVAQNQVLQINNKNNKKCMLTAYLLFIHRHVNDVSILPYLHSLQNNKTQVYISKDYTCFCEIVMYSIC